jgi:ArsR family transcriptional regulator
MATPDFLDQIATLADGTRARLLQVLEHHELTVSELCDVLQLPQSTVSRQLKVLGEQSWLGRRPDGNRAFYTMNLDSLSPAERRMWWLIRDQLRGTAQDEQDEARLQRVLHERRSRSEEFFSTQASQWGELRRELFGQRFDLVALLGLLDPAWVVGDLGCGTGELSRVLAPFVDRVIAVDRSLQMLDAASSALESELRESGKVEFRSGDLESLPIDNGQLDAATLLLVLNHCADSAKVLREAARVLKPGAPLLIVDMMPHSREEYRQQMGHVWLGFSEETLCRQLEAAGLVSVRYQALPAEKAAKGPRLFVATGRQVGEAATTRVAKATTSIEMPERQIQFIDD